MWETVTEELEKNEISIVAGTIFQDLVSRENHANVLKAADDICWLIHTAAEAAQIMRDRIFRRLISSGSTGDMMSVILHPDIRSVQKDSNRHSGNS